MTSRKTQTGKGQRETVCEKTTHVSVRVSGGGTGWKGVGERAVCVVCVCACAWVWLCGACPRVCVCHCAACVSRPSRGPEAGDTLPPVTVGTACPLRRAAARLRCREAKGRERQGNRRHRALLGPSSPVSGQRHRPAVSSVCPRGRPPGPPGPLDGHSVSGSIWAQDGEGQEFHQGFCRAHTSGSVRPPHLSPARPWRENPSPILQVKDLGAGRAWALSWATRARHPGPRRPGPFGFHSPTDCQGARAGGTGRKQRLSRLPLDGSRGRACPPSAPDAASVQGRGLGPVTSPAPVSLRPSAEGDLKASFLALSLGRLHGTTA